MADIKLPPMPIPEGNFDIVSCDDIRARDLEVARAALEAAAFVVLGNKHRNATDLELAHAIRKLKVSHD
jgi:hypothetical protein